MLKRILLGVVWFLVIWFVVRLACDVAAGAVAGARNPANAAYAGAQAALSPNQHYGWLILLVALVLAAAGGATGILPGTGPARPKPQGPIYPPQNWPPGPQPPNSPPPA